MPANPHRLAILATALLFGLAVSTGPSFAAGDPEPRGQQPPPPPPATDKQDPGKASQKKKPEKKSEQEFIDGYRAARALALDGKYEAAIAAFRALGHDDSAEVANYIGYANRKLGNYEAARIWYEKALAADPNHVRTWQWDVARRAGQSAESPGFPGKDPFDLRRHRVPGIRRPQGRHRGTHQLLRSRPRPATGFRPNFR